MTEPDAAAMAAMNARLSAVEGALEATLREQLPQYAIDGDQNPCAAMALADLLGIVLAGATAMLAKTIDKEVREAGDALDLAPDGNAVLLGVRHGQREMFTRVLERIQVSRDMAVRDTILAIMKKQAAQPPATPA